MRRDGGRLPLEGDDGGHRRFSKAALLDSKARSKERQSKGLDTMMEASRKLGLYDENFQKLLGATAVDQPAGALARGSAANESVCRDSP